MIKLLLKSHISIVHPIKERFRVFNLNLTRSKDILCQQNMNDKEDIAEEHTR
jgi:hypothetical protein